MENAAGHLGCIAKAKKQKATQYDCIYRYTDSSHQLQGGKEKSELHPIQVFVFIECHLHSNTAVVYSRLYLEND